MDGNIIVLNRKKLPINVGCSCKRHVYAKSSDYFEVKKTCVKKNGYM